MPELKGILPAVVTPLDGDDRFNPAAFERLLEKIYQAGVDGVYVCGQTGEGLLQSVDQRKQVAEAAMRCSPHGKNVVVHVGAYRTADAVELAKHAAQIGAHAISSLPPLGNYSFAEIRAYYERLAGASGVPLLVYYFPAVAPGIGTLDQILELCRIPNVVGLKFTAYDLYTLSMLKREGKTVFNGYDELLVAGLLMGADGGIGSFYNVVPHLFCSIYNHARAGEWKEAREVQERVNALITIGMRFPVFPAVKAMLAWSGIDCGRCLAPRRSLTPVEQSELEMALAGDDSLASPAGNQAL